MKMQILSVAENEGRSDSIAASQDSRGLKLKMEIDFDRTVSISSWVLSIPAPRITEIKFRDIDIDGMIEFLLEAKRLISEEEMYKKLVGVK